MHIGKRLVGLGVVTLGVLGIAVCLAGIAGAWTVGSRLRQVNSSVFSQADRLVGQVERRTAQARDVIGGTRELIDELKQTLQDSAKKRLAERVSSLPEIENLERRAAAAMERADGLVQISASTAELIEQLLATAGTVAAERDVDLIAPSELMAAIRSTRESLAHASRRLADVERRLAEIRQQRDMDVNLSQITELSLGIIAQLDVVQERIVAFRSRLDEMRHRLGQLRDRISVWVLAGQWLIVLLITWGGAGQFCLLLQGWRILRTPPPPAS